MTGASILQVAHGLYPQAPGGVELYTLEVARALGGAVLSLTPRTADDRIGDAWDGLRVLTPAAGESLTAAWHRALDEVAPAAVFIQRLGGLSPALLRELRERGIPYAVFLHDFTPVCPTHQLWHRGDRPRSGPCSGPGRTGFKCAWCVSGAWGRVAELPLRAALYQHRPQTWRSALLGAEVLVANSRFARDFWIAQGAPPERIAVIAPALPAAAAASSPAPAPAGAARLLYAGGWGVAKGGALLAAAIEQLPGPFELDVIGRVDEPARRQFRQAVPARHGMVFHGALPPSQVAVRMAACRAVLVPSRWQETYSRIAGEAQRLGIPVVATAVGALPERIIHGVNGFLAAADDPAALAESILEACGPLPGWDAAGMARQSQAEAAEALAQLRRLAELLTAPADTRLDEPGLELQFHGLLRRWSDQSGAPESELRPRLVAALRGESALPPGPAAEARAMTRQGRAQLNHAIAFFRGCGCRRIAGLDVESDIWSGLMPHLAAWGLEPAPAATADGLLAVAATESASPRSLPALRQRFPGACALVVWLPETVETVNLDAGFG